MSKNPATRRKHIPERTCVVCRAKAEKRALTRIVRTADGLQIDRRGKVAGRGSYLCERAECWEHAAASDVLGRALRTTLTDEDRQRLLRARPSPSS